MGQDVRELFTGDFRPWLLGQHHRDDRTGHAARTVLGCPRCTGRDERELVEHASRDHRRADVVKLVSAVHEWRRVLEEVV